MNRPSLFHLWILFFIFSLSMNSCKDTSHRDGNQQHLEENIPLIEREMMIQLLTESYIVEGVIFTSPSDMNKSALTRHLYAELFEKYNITSKEFEYAIRYYCKNKEKSKILLDEVKLALENQRDSLQQIISPNIDDENEIKR